MVGTGNTNKINHGSDSKGAVSKGEKHNVASIMIVIVYGGGCVLCACATYVWIWCSKARHLESSNCLSLKPGSLLPIVVYFNFK